MLKESTTILTDAEFNNTGYFIFPLKVNDAARFHAFLASPEHHFREEKEQPFVLNYIMHYASQMPVDGRLRTYRYEACEELHLNLFSHVTFKTHDLPRSGYEPTLLGISLYEFQTGIALLEVAFEYNQMLIEEIVDFNYLFRSLRYDETARWPEFPEGTISARTMLATILPEKETGSVLCFYNPSDLKMQAQVFTFLTPKNQEMAVLTGQDDTVSQEQLNRWSYLLARGFSLDFSERVLLDGTDEVNKQFSFSYSFGEKTYWNGSLDGIACITNHPSTFQYYRLTQDYHYLYLMLLHQRFCALANIEALSAHLDDDAVVAVTQKQSAELKCRYSFRVISEVENMQIIYGRMYEVLRIDTLLADIDDMNERIASLRELESQKHEQRLSGLLTVISILAIFSALIDLADFLNKFLTSGEWYFALASLVVNVIIVVIAAVFIFRKK